MGVKNSRLVKILKRNEAPELGFGTNSNESGQRILNKDGTANVARLGEPHFNVLNIYHSLITMSWWRFNFVILLYYFTLNLLFSLAYYFLTPLELTGMVYQTPGEHFQEIFFFSAQSLTTVGYGRVNPTGTLASSLASLEALVGLMGFALATGLLYGRFSRATAKILYSENMLIGPYTHPVLSANAPTALLFRIANARRNQLIEVEAQVIFGYNEEADGKIKRKFQQLNLEISKINMLAMSWTITHPINAESPLYGLSPSDLEQIDAEFFVNLKAIDDTYVQQVYDRSSYKWEEVIWNARFDPVITRTEDGRTAIDLRKLSTYQLSDA